MPCALLIRMRALEAGRPFLDYSMRSIFSAFSILILALALAAGDCVPLSAQSQQLAHSHGARSVTDLPAPPADPAALRIWSDAQRVSGPRLLVSLEERRVWHMNGNRVLFTAPVAIGKSVILEWEDREWNFATPRGRRTVLGKEKNPVWVPPDWHYVELALAQGWQLEAVTRGKPFRLSDGSKVTVRGRSIGRTLPDGSFVAVPPGDEAVFEGTLFMPPIGSDNRRIPGELGRFKIDLGDAYYFHGTPYEQSIGTASTHGCLRLMDADIEHLYQTVRVGTPVFIY
jgi:hypothetical protein